jgi:adenylate cyclase
MLRELSVSTPIDKTRYQVRCGDHVWDLDLFHGENAGLIMAEVELERPDEPFEMPTWAGQEVSADLRYYNVNLAQTPYTRW